MWNVEHQLIAFARASARLAEPFANRLHILADLQLSEAAWHELERH